MQFSRQIETLECGSIEPRPGRKLNLSSGECFRDIAAFAPQLPYQLEMLAEWMSIQPGHGYRADERVSTQHRGSLSR
jgi:hypothetical protein